MIWVWACVNLFRGIYSVLFGGMDLFWCKKWMIWEMYWSDRKIVLEWTRFSFISKLLSKMEKRSGLTRNSNLFRWNLILGQVWASDCRKQHLHCVCCRTSGCTGHRSDELNCVCVCVRAWQRVFCQCVTQYPFQRWSLSKQSCYGQNQNYLTELCMCAHLYVFYSRAFSE